jgi:hypothetical protein
VFLAQGPAFSGIEPGQDLLDVPQGLDGPLHGRA